LLHLSEKLDLTNAAASKLDVVGRPPQSPRGPYGRGSGA
jgi:hypothetical protein